MIEFPDFGEPVSKRSGFDITPMIDMIFLLLIFFLLTSTLSSPVININLPEASVTESKQPEGMIIAVDSAEIISVNGDPVDTDELMSAIRLHRGDTAIYIQSDESVPFGTVIKIMDICRSAGSFDISFIVDKETSAEPE